MKIKLLLGMLIACLASSAVHAVERISVDDFFKNPQFASLQLSPDGKELAALANVGGPEEAARLRELMGAGYLSPEGRDEAGPPPEGLVDHMLEDLDYTIKCSMGEAPRPSEDEGRHGEWWQGG